VQAFSSVHLAGGSRGTPTQAAVQARRHFRPRALEAVISQDQRIIPPLGRACVLLSRRFPQAWASARPKGRRQAQVFGTPISALFAPALEDRTQRVPCAATALREHCQGEQRRTLRQRRAPGSVPQPRGRAAAHLGEPRDCARGGGSRGEPRGQRRGAPEV